MFRFQLPVGLLVGSPFCHCVRQTDSLTWVCAAGGLGHTLGLILEWVPFNIYLDFIFLAKGGTVVSIPPNNIMYFIDLYCAFVFINCVVIFLSVIVHS